MPDKISNKALLDYETIGQLKVHKHLAKFVREDLLPNTNIAEQNFWAGCDELIKTFTPQNQKLLKEREALQAQLDDWHQNNTYTPESYRAFLKEVGYLEKRVPDFNIETSNIDTEIANIAGPQLVVPVSNARFAINACNARWGSLYDALYGTDIISEAHGAERGKTYNPTRGNKVISFAKDFLNKHFPLAEDVYQNITKLYVNNQQLFAELKNGNTAQLKDMEKFSGYYGPANNPTRILLNNNGLHIEIRIDKKHEIGKNDPAGIADLIVESAITTIIDFEDSVAAVDAEDKVCAYKNWLGLMTGNLRTEVSKNNHTFTRKMNADREYVAPDGSPFSLHGRSLLFVRNVGHLMTNPAMLDHNDEEVYEGILDGIFTSFAAIPDILADGKKHKDQQARRNSRTGNIYIVKPKMHGPKEVDFTVRLFTAIEKLLQLPDNSLKLGIMDEERRTSVNLKACIHAARTRVVFINTGFLDRTGDEIHTSMKAGPFAPKATIKAMPWIDAYETSNVATGLSCGLSGKAQIGKGMWPMPDKMEAMYQTKIAHPKAGANTAWVPSPTAATLHALHYHEVDVKAQQDALKASLNSDLNTILEIPLLGDTTLSDTEIQHELDNNIQGILGYVVRWIDLGIGCSKVPDINDIGLMEDRATLRISSQHIYNWLYHGICTEQQIKDTLEKMAAIVDKQNSRDPAYTPMTSDLSNSLAFKAATNLIFNAGEQPNGYTEPLLHHFRKLKKARS